MPDDLRKRGKRDRDRVATREPYELRRWAKKFRVPRYVLVLAHEALFADGKANTVANFVELLKGVHECVADQDRAMRKARKAKARG